MCGWTAKFVIQRTFPLSATEWRHHPTSTVPLTIFISTIQFAIFNVHFLTEQPTARTGSSCGTENTHTNASNFPHLRQALGAGNGHGHRIIS